MKLEEATSSVIKCDFVRSTDGEQVSKYGEEFNTEMDLTVNLTLFKLVKIYDLYRDQTVMYRQLRPGVGAGSPYADSLVVLKV